MQINSGIKTSEFWVTLLPTVIAMLVLTGVIDQGDTDMTMSLAKDIVSGIIALVSITTYIVNRSNLKKEIVKASVEQSRIIEKPTMKTEESLLG